MMHLQEEEVVLVQAVMLHHAVPEMVEFSLDKEELDSKPGNSYITSLVELSRAAREEKTLSDGPDPESDYAPARLSPAHAPAPPRPARPTPLRPAPVSHSRWGPFRYRLWNCCARKVNWLQTGSRHWNNEPS